MADALQKQYEEISKQVDEFEQQFRNRGLKRVRNAILSRLGNKAKDYLQDIQEAERSGQRAIPKKHFTLLRKMEALERQFIREGNKSGGK